MESDAKQARPLALGSRVMSALQAAWKGWQSLYGKSHTEDSTERGSDSEDKEEMRIPPTVFPQATVGQLPARFRVDQLPVFEVQVPASAMQNGSAGAP